jgi:hypothetical protein
MLRVQCASGASDDDGFAFEAAHELPIVACGLALAALPNFKQDFKRPND